MVLRLTRTAPYCVEKGYCEREQNERKLLLLIGKNAAKTRVGNKVEKPIPVNLSHVEKGVENAPISRVSGSRGGQRFFRGFSWLRDVPWAAK